MSFEDVEGPAKDQVYLKYSRDGLNWGDPANRGTPVQAQGGEYPINTPVVRWVPIGGPKGVVVVSARGARGDGAPSGRSFYWNLNEWGWSMVGGACAGAEAMNGRSGWTQAVMLKPDGSILHITSSALVDAINDSSRNQILFASAKLDLNRYEAEDAARQGSAVMRDVTMSNGAKVRLGAKDIGRPTFHVHLAQEGQYTLAIDYGDIGFSATPRLFANGQSLQGTVTAGKRDPASEALRNADLGTRGNGDRILLTAAATLKAGENVLEIAGGAYALDIDYVEITLAAP